MKKFLAVATVLFLSAGLYAQAVNEEAALLAQIDQNPRNAEAYNQLLRLYANQGKKNERLKLAIKAIQQLGGSSQLYIIVGDEYKSLGEYTKSLIAYQFAVKLDPTSPNVYNRMGLVLLKLDSFNQAESAFRAAIFFSGERESAQVRSFYYNNLAVCYEAMKDLKTAYRVFQTATRLNPGYELAQSNVVRVRDIMRSQGISVD